MAPVTYDKEIAASRGTEELEIIAIRYDYLP
jgi:hypothetical protein